MCDVFVGDWSIPPPARGVDCKESAPNRAPTWANPNLPPIFGRGLDRFGTIDLINSDEGKSREKKNTHKSSRVTIHPTICTPTRAPRGLG